MVIVYIWNTICLNSGHSNSWEVPGNQISTRSETLYDANVCPLRVSHTSSCFTGHLLLHNAVIDVMNVINNSIHNRTVTERYCTQMPESHRVFYNGDWSIMVLLFGSVVPGTIILTGNVGIAVTVIKIGRRVRPAMQHRNVAQDVHKTPTKLVFALTAMFLCATLPFTLYIVNMEYTRQVDNHTLAMHQLVTVYVYCSVWCNHSFNCIVYVMHGTQFKKEWNVIAQSIMTIVTRAFNGAAKSTASAIIRPT